MSSKNFHQAFTETESAVNEYNWTLYNFSSCNKVEESIESQIFSSLRTLNDFTSVSRWQIKLFPNGYNKQSKEYVAIFLESLNHFEITVNYELNINVGKVKHPKLNHTFYRSGNFWGYSNFINRNSLLDDLKKENDTLIITCKIFLVNVNRKIPQINIGKLLDSQEHCDIVLKSSDGSEHKAHKAILSCNSKVFAAMFEHGMKETQENLVRIEDVDNKTLKEMLRFIYTGNIENMKDDLISKLLIAADKYELDDLKDVCIHYLRENINIDNILDLVELADVYNICELKPNLNVYFVKNCRTIMKEKGPEYGKDLSKRTVEMLLYTLASNH